ncbi:hypothetical protein BDR07DRAFT_1461926 [Suillus spraguei]|nr:hypothetical protein BDR07DRAFT_1461926 [Suillus spraguei]
MHFRLVMVQYDFHSTHIICEQHPPNEHHQYMVCGAAEVALVPTTERSFPLNAQPLTTNRITTSLPLMNRTAQLEKRFNDILNGRVTADARSYALFLEAICAQQDPATCINKIVESSHGPSAVQAAMRHNTIPSFSMELQPSFCYISSEQQTLLTQAFDQGELNEQAQEAFAALLLRLMCLTTGNTSSYHDLAKKSSILTRLLDSSQSIVKDAGYRIRHILSTFTESGIPVAAVGGPGGRHDNDFDNFREISILPTADEILCQQPPFIRPSSVLEDPDGEETRTADYLDNTFRLLREDMLYQMREVLQTVIGKKKGRHRGLTMDGVTLDGVYSGTDDRKTRWGIKLKCRDDFKSMKSIPVEQRKIISKKILRALEFSNISLSYAYFRELK